jgi:hypothetical protein
MKMTAALDKTHDDLAEMLERIRHLQRVIASCSIEHASLFFNELGLANSISSEVRIAARSLSRV